MQQQRINVLCRNLKLNGNEGGLIILKNSVKYYCPTSLAGNIMIIESLKGEIKTYLFLDSLKEITPKEHGVDSLYAISQLEDMLDSLIDKHSKDKIYVDVPKKKSSGDVISVVDIIEQQRCVKSTEELELIFKSSQISAAVHVESVKSLKPYMNRMTVVDNINAIIKKCNSFMAYGPSITCSSWNDSQGNRFAKDTFEFGKLVTMDIGTDFQGYKTTIARTYPISGKFTNSQAKVYQMVLNVQKECILTIKAKMLLTDLYDKSVFLVTRGLISLGILSGAVEANIKQDNQRKFYFTPLSHWIGSEVYDCNTCSRKEVPLEPGHVFTIDVHVKIGKEPSIPEEFRGIEVRIKDVIALMPNGKWILTGDCPKELVDIEKLI